MMSAGAVTAAPASPGATRPTAVVTPMSRPVARARRPPEPDFRPGGGVEPRRGSSMPARAGAGGDAEAVRDTEDVPFLGAGGGAAGRVRARRSSGPGHAGDSRYD